MFINFIKKYFYTIPQNIFERFFIFFYIFGVRAMYAVWCSVKYEESAVLSLYSRRFNQSIFFRPASYDVQVLQQVFVNKEYSISQDLNPKFIIDAGAHCGFASIFFGNEYPDAQIISIEPNKNNFSILKKNVEKNNNIAIIQSALLADVKSVSANKTHNKFASFYAEDDPGSALRSTTVSEILKSSNYDQVDILKLDIEGAEKEIFENAENWIDFVEVIFVESHDQYVPGSEALILKVAEKSNFQVDCKGENILLKKSA